MNNENFKTNIQAKTKSFVESNISIIIFSSLLLIVSLVQIFIFLFTDLTMSGFESSDKQAWVTWSYIIISFPMGVASVMSMMLSIRGSKNFIAYALVVELGYTISGLSGGMMYSTIVIVMLLFVNLFRYYKIKTEGENYIVNVKLIYAIMTIIIIALIITGPISIELDDNHVFWWNENVYGETTFIQYLDVITAVFTLMGGVMILTKNKYAFIWFFACDVCFLILFINAHQWSNVFLTLIFIAMEILGFIVWGIEDEK